MDSKLTKTAGTLMTSRMMGGFRLSWLVYGAAAYYGLKYMNKRGILPTQTGVAISIFDKGIGFVKSQFGLGSSDLSSSSSLSNVGRGMGQSQSQSSSQFPH